METKEMKELRFGSDEKIAGVVSGIAEYMGIDTKAARIAYATLTVLTGLVFGVIAYIIFAFIMVTNEDRRGNSAIMEAK